MIRANSVTEWASLPFLGTEIDERIISFSRTTCRSCHRPDRVSVSSLVKTRQDDSEIQRIVHESYDYCILCLVERILDTKFFDYSFFKSKVFYKVRLRGFTDEVWDLQNTEIKHQWAQLGHWWYVGAKCLVKRRKTQLVIKMVAERLWPIGGYYSDGISDSFTNDESSGSDATSGSDTTLEGSE